MAILQISQITQRKGLQADLPQLAGAELGWSIDERRLWIGNGTIAEGAPVVGNTEILTEYSNIANILTYTYSGYSASGYTAANTVPVLYQNWFDQYASVLDWGIVGDGVTDVTAAINNALYQMYCVDPTSPAARRALFFPAGVYVVSSSILIPANATLVGDGSENTIIQYTGTSYVAQTADNTQTVGAAATASNNINISKMGFQNLGSGDVFLVENAVNTTFNNVAFLGPQTTATIPTTADTSAAVRCSITSASYSVEQVVFDECVFSGTVYGVTTDTNTTGVTFTNSEFNTLAQGVILGPTATANGPSGFRITNCVFDTIYNEGIIVGNSGNPTATELNTLGHNVFLDVGNNFVTGTPITPVITFNSSNNLSIGDMFARTDTEAITQPRIYIVGDDNISTQNGTALALGNYTLKASRMMPLTDGTTATLFTQDVTGLQAFSFQYTVFRNPGATQTVRTGTFSTASNVGGTLNWSDDYTENGTTGITITATRVSNTVTVTYTTTAVGTTGLMQYSVNYFA